MFKNLRELILSMPTEEICREYLAKQRWPDGKVTCPYCGHPKSYVIDKGERYKCASKECYKRFRITVGTIFESSNVPLTKWFTAIYLITAHKKGISSHQLGKDISVTQQTAWFMLHRVREMLRKKEAVMLGMDKAVEADETYVGGSISNKHISKRKEYAKNPELYNNKTTVLGMIERGGELVTKVISGQPYEIVSKLSETVESNARVITDTAKIYDSLNRKYNHDTINHKANEYIRGDIYTNTIEGAFSHFKRMVYGIYHQISPKHTHRYCDEFTHRYNTRKMKDSDRFQVSLKGLECRLKYADLIAAPEIKNESYKPVKAKDGDKGIYQIKYGEIVGYFKSTVEAYKATGIDRKNILKTCQGLRLSAGGFEWTFA